MEQASGELMQAAFSRRVLKDGLTQAQRLVEAEHVLNEFGQCVVPSYTVYIFQHTPKPPPYQQLL